MVASVDCGISTSPMRSITQRRPASTSLVAMPPGPSPITSAPSPDSSAPGQATSSGGTDDGSHVRRSPDQEPAPAADPDHAVLLRTQRQGGVAAELGGAGEDLARIAAASAVPPRRMWASGAKKIPSM